MIERTNSFFEKLMVIQLTKKLPVMFVTRRFITVFTTAWHWTISWDGWTQFTTSHSISL